MVSVRLLALAAAGALAALGVLAAQASAAGSKAGSPTAAQDQYSTPTVVTPTTPSSPLKPPSHQASAPVGKPTGAPKPTLPFTGLSLLKVVLVGAALLVLGLLLRRGLPRRGP